MSDWNLGRVVRVAAAFVYSYYTGQWQVFASQLVREQGSVKRNKARRRAIEQYNASLQDRLEMVDLQPDAPRTLVLGRVRTVEGIRRRWTSGPNEERLTMVVSFAGHEIDAFEQWYVDDVAVTLDGDGWVQQAPWGATTTQQTELSGTLDGTGGAVVTLPGTLPVGAQLLATWYSGAGETYASGNLTTSVVGVSATLSGGPPGASYSVLLNQPLNKRRIRIRPYLGTAAQNVGADLVAEYPGQLTGNDRFAGIALAVVDCIFDTDAFPQGRPNITAVVRGARCLDPRTGTTAWTENPALHAYHYARHATGWALQVGDINTADVIAAANACDVSTTFTLRKVDGSTSTVTLPRHRSGAVIADDADHEQAMEELIDAMAGRWCMPGGVLRMRAAELRATATTITQDWLVREVGDGGEVSDEPVITAVQTVPSTRRANYVSGSCIDPAQRYQALPFPAVQDAVLVAAKGRRPLEVRWGAVNHVAHAQHLASILIREAQAGLRLELMCDDRAADLELLDVVAVDMAEYGYSGKLFEVVGWEWTQRGAYKVQLHEISADLFTPLAELTGRDPAPDSNLRAPWDVEAIGTPSVASGLASLVDGSIVSRTVVQWPAAVGQYIRQGGRIEVQYIDAAEDFTVPDWPAVFEQGAATSTAIVGLLAGHTYYFRVRAEQSLPLVRGPWSAIVRHKVGAAPLVGTAQIKDNAVSKTTFDEHDFAGASFRTSTVRTITYTPPSAAKIEFSAKFVARNCLESVGNRVMWQCEPATGGVIYLGGSESDSSDRTEFAVVSSLDAAAGVALTFRMVVNDAGLLYPPIDLWKSYARITANFK